LKLPVSVLVVVHAGHQVLLIERLARPGFWQSVTGSLEHAGEAPEAAALREVAEETGIVAPRQDLRRWNLAYTFEIYAEWRHRFVPGTVHNTEHVFSLALPAPVPVTLAPAEHRASCWLAWPEAAMKCFSWSNRDAIRILGQCDA
jgi:dihydroneopterin triphosphate diphosphatase